MKCKNHRKIILSTIFSVLTTGALMTALLFPNKQSISTTNSLSQANTQLTTKTTSINTAEISPKEPQTPDADNNYQYFPKNDLTTSSGTFNKQGGNWSADFSVVFGNVRQDSPFYIFMNNLFTGQTSTIVPSWPINQSSMMTVMDRTGGVLDLSNLALENYMFDIFKFFNLTKVKYLDLSGNKLNFLPDNLFANTVFLDTNLPNTEDSDNVTRALTNGFLNLETLIVNNNVGFNQTSSIFKEELLRRPTFTGEWFQNSQIAEVSFVKSELNNNSLQPLLNGGGDTFFRSLTKLNISQNPQITNEPVMLGGTSIEPVITSLLHLWNQKVIGQTNGRVFNASNCNILSIDVNDLIAKNYSSVLSKGFKELNFANNNDMHTFTFNSKSQPPRVKPTILDLDLTNTKIRHLDDFAGFMSNNTITGNNDSNYNPLLNIKLSLSAVNVTTVTSVLPPTYVDIKPNQPDQVATPIFRALELPLEIFPSWIYKTGQSNGKPFWESLLTLNSMPSQWEVNYRASPETRPVDVKDLFEKAIKDTLLNNKKAVSIEWKEINRRVNVATNTNPLGDPIQEGFHDNGEFSFTNGVEFILNVITDDLEEIQVNWDLKNNKSFFILSELGNFKHLAVKKPDEVLNKELAPETTNGLMTKTFFDENILTEMISKNQLKFNDDGILWNSSNLQLIGTRQIPKISLSTVKPIGISVVPGQSKINNDLGSISLKIKVLYENTIKFFYTPPIFGFQAEDPKIVPHEVVQILSNLDILTNLPDGNKDIKRLAIQKNIENLNNHYADVNNLKLVEDFKTNGVFAVLNKSFTKNLNVESIVPNGSTPLISFQNFNGVLDFQTTIMKVNFKYLTSKNGIENFEIYNQTFELKKLEEQADVQLSASVNDPNNSSTQIRDKILEIGSTKALNSPLTIGQIFLETLPSEINRSDLYFYWEAFFTRTSGVSDKSIEITFDNNNSRNAFDDTGAISFKISFDIWDPETYKFETTNKNADFVTIWMLFKRTPTNFYWNDYNSIQSSLKGLKLEADAPEIQKTTIQQLLTLTEQNINLVTVESLEKLNTNLKNLEANQPTFYIRILRILINEKMSWRVDLKDSSKIPKITFALGSNELMNQGKIFLNLEVPQFYSSDINFTTPGSGEGYTSNQIIKQDIKIIKAITETAEVPDDFNSNISSPILWITEDFLTNNKIDITQNILVFKQQIANSVPSILRIPQQYQNDTNFWNAFRELNPNLIENIIVTDAKTAEPIPDDSQLTPDQNLLVNVYFNYHSNGQTISSVATSSIINSSTFLFESLGNTVIIAAASILGVSALVVVLLSIYLMLDKRKNLKATKQFKVQITKEKQKIAAALTPEDKLKRLDLVKQDNKIQKVLDFSSTLEKTIFSEKEQETSTKKVDEEF